MAFGKGKGQYDETIAEIGKQWMDITNGLPHAIGTLAELSQLPGMDPIKVVQFIKERGLPEDRDERRKWWQENMSRLRGQVEMKGGEFEKDT